MAENENNVTQDQAGGDSSASGGACCSAGAGWESWKTVVFILILLAAAALAGRSLLTNSRCGGTAVSGSSGSSCGGCPFSLCSQKPASCPQQEACCEGEEKQNSDCCPLSKQTEDSAPACPGATGPCCGKPGS